MNQQLTIIIQGLQMCLDGIKVRIQGPRQNEMDCICRKGFHALNIQVSALKIYIIALHALEYVNVFFFCFLCVCHGKVH